MSSRNVIVFGAPNIDRRFFLLLAGVSEIKGRPGSVFEATKHTVTISRQFYTLYNTGGLSDDDDHPVDVRRALVMLHRFTRILDGAINLLVYVVHEQPTVNNYRLFYECLCGGEVPIILFQTDSDPTVPIDPRFMFDHRLFDFLKEEVQDAIHRRCKKKAKLIPPEDLFMKTAMESWMLLEKTAGWPLYDCRDALKGTLIEEACLSEADAENTCIRVTEHIKRNYFRNVIVFGSTGAGKTSVISMLTDKCFVPEHASSAGGSTFESKSYRVELGDHHYIFHDTVGLNDATSEFTSPQKSLRNLFRLITKIEGGVSLLVYVHRGKIQRQNIDDYRLFNAVCENKVPIALVVTGLEGEESVDNWWMGSKRLFENARMQTEHVACITADKGKWVERFQAYKNQEEYDESKERLLQMLLAAPLENVWKVKASNWISTALVEVYGMLARRFNWHPLASNQWLVDSFVNNLHMPKDGATSLAWDLERVLKRT